MTFPERTLRTATWFLVAVGLIPTCQAGPCRANGFSPWVDGHRTPIISVYFPGIGPETSPVSHAFHADVLLLDQPGGAVVCRGDLGASSGLGSSERPIRGERFTQLGEGME